MSTPRGSGPGQIPQPPDSDPAVEALLEYLSTTAVTPPADLTARIQARIAREPDRTPPRRYLLALLHLRLRTAAGAFRQLVSVAGGRGTFPALLRVQALGLVLVTVLAAVALGAGAVVGVTKLVQDRRVTDPTPHPTRTILPGPTLSPTPRQADDLTTPVPSPSDGVHLLDASTPPVEPTRTARPSKTPRQAGGSDATPHPAKTPRVERPEPTRTPHPTPKKTLRPDRTPRPTERPERTERPEPTDTPESGDGKGGNGPGESEAPDSHGDSGSVWIGDVWLAGLVPLGWSGAAEGQA